MIPKLDVRRLCAEKKDSGELEFEFEPEADLVSIPYVSFASPVKAKFHYEIADDDSVEVRGKVIFTLKGLCSRCLKETSKEIEGDAEGVFVPASKQCENDAYSYTGFVIDLTEFTRDAVLFSIPSGLYCSGDCSAPDYK